MINLKALAFDHGLKQKDIAEILGVDQPAASRIINGRLNLTQKHIEKLVQKFGEATLKQYDVTPEAFYQARDAQITMIPHAIVEDIKEEMREEISAEVRKEEGIEEATTEEVEIKETIILGADAINKVGVDLRKELKKSPEDMVLDVEVKPTQDVLPPHEVKIYTENDEMASDIEPNDPVFAHLIPSPKLFKPRHMYLVNLEYGSVVRWVVPEGEDHIRLVSRKGSDVVPISSVKAMFEVVAITKRPKTLPIDLTTESQRMERKESQLNTMLEQQGRLIGIIEGQIKHE